MSEVVVVKGDTGKLEGIGEKGSSAWSRFLAKITSMGIGDTLRFVWHEPRSLQHHRKFFVKLHALLDRQEQFDSEDHLRQWLTVGAGYCTFVPGPDGITVALADSIAFHKLDEVEFTELHAGVDRFLYSPHAQAFLWPHLSAQLAYENIDRLIGEFR